MNALTILFSPQMYSAYDGTNKYQIPAIVNGLDNTKVSWSASPASAVELAPDMSTGGIMITTKEAPGKPVTITANLAGQCGTSQLNITQATTAQWQAGHDRYNSTVPLEFACVVKGIHAPLPEGGCPDAGPACTNCHGPTAMAMTGFMDVAHTPEQTGGFSDSDMINIVVNAIVPGCGDAGACADGGYFDPSVLTGLGGFGFTPYEVWRLFHQWIDITGDEQEAMVIYLRSLTPSSQQGDFGQPPRPDGGYPRRDSGTPAADTGAPPAVDSGTPADDSGTPVEDSGTPTEAAPPPAEAGGGSNDSGSAAD